MSENPDGLDVPDHEHTGWGRDKRNDCPGCADRYATQQGERFRALAAALELVGRVERLAYATPMQYPDWSRDMREGFNRAIALVRGVAMGDIDIIEYAIRYCVSRNSYAFEDGLDLAERHWSRLAESTKRDVLYGVRHNERIDLSRWPTIQAVRFPTPETTATPCKTCGGFRSIQGEVEGVSMGLACPECSIPESADGPA